MPDMAADAQTAPMNGSLRLDVDRGNVVKEVADESAAQRAGLTATQLAFRQEDRSEGPGLFAMMAPSSALRAPSPPQLGWTT